MIKSLIVDILAQMSNLLTKREDLEKKYGLCMHSAGDKKVEDLEPDHDVSLREGSALQVASALIQKRAESLPEFQKRISKMAKVKWAVRDKKRFNDFIGSLSDFNAALCDILPPSRRSAYHRALQLEQPSDNDRLQLISNHSEWVDKDYAAAARFKQLHLLQQRSTSPTSGNELPKPIKIPFNNLESRGPTKQNRTLAQIQQKDGTTTHVLVELKTLTDPDPRIISTLERRLMDLIALLQVAPKPSKYRVLDCLGFFTTPGQDHQYGLIFALPEFTVPARIPAPPLPRVETLYSFLRTAADNKVPVCFCLEARFRLAALLASSVSSIHAAGWLHHNINSSNILCLLPDGEAEDSIERPYLSGFGYARVDDPREVSEVTNENDIDRLYQHPDYQTPLHPNHKYRRSYDFYSLGIVLIEIGLWKRISSLRRRGLDERGFAQDIQRRLVPMLGYYMGEQYRDAVASCLDRTRLKVGDDEDKRLSESFSRNVVRVLEDCHA
ncbi:hypothetical protein BDV36DRAFT_245634 [Aspergillus pseudocaelatus]|uniref:Protein kinase domain-containing protein n=1 Tax=Aspergillus pseudocaelatus TaxID=1825620 RepID=A0ABQ6WZ56_9EURO|nr:hypothetical protein BDV36DRAFT_245634 [Aspergillus pseudocaelatus]